MGYIGIGNNRLKQRLKCLTLWMSCARYIVEDKMVVTGACMTLTQCHTL